MNESTNTDNTAAPVAPDSTPLINLFRALRGKRRKNTPGAFGGTTRAKRVAKRAAKMATLTAAPQ